MPREAHEALEKAATKKGLTGEGRKRYVHGALNRMKKAKKSKKGMTMDHVGAALSARRGGY